MNPACSGNASLDGVAAPEGASELLRLGLGLFVAQIKHVGLSVQLLDAAFSLRSARKHLHVNWPCAC